MGYIQIFDYSVTGDCSNTGLGGVSFSITGDSPGWAVFELSSGGTFPSSANTSNYEFQGLNYGVYFLEILDAANNITMEPYRAFVSDKLIPEQHSVGFLTQSAFTQL